MGGGGEAPYGGWLPRTYTAASALLQQKRAAGACCKQAYCLAPLPCSYIETFQAGFDEGLKKVPVYFMQASGAGRRGSLHCSRFLALFFP